MGLDVEMVIHEHYYEILDVAEELFAFLFGQLLTAPSCRPLLEMVREQHPFARAPRGLRGGGGHNTPCATTTMAHAGLWGASAQ